VIEINGTKVLVLAIFAIAVLGLVFAGTAGAVILENPASDYLPDQANEEAEYLPTPPGPPGTVVIQDT
jgi:hypothetical protein